ncbi:MAG: acetoacetate--CoA ligase [Pseudomonadota bacterium]
MTDALWRPSQDRIESTQLAAFAKQVGLDDPLDYDRLWQYSVEQPESFWRSVWHYCEIVGEPGDTVIKHGPHLTDHRFFPDARINFAENLLATSGAPEPALISLAEHGARWQLSRAKLAERVSRLQQAMRAAGLGEGDRVAAILPNSVDAVVSMLAATSLGAVWSSCSPDFGVSGMLDRFGQIEPKLLICCDGYHYNGNAFKTLDNALELRQSLPSVEKLIVAQQLDEEPNLAGHDAVSMLDFIEAFAPAAVEYTRVAFSAPLYILFSSGTTGKPKCIVHSVGGTLLQHAKEHRLHCDLKPGDRLFYFTTCGWMMWNWLTSALASGATLVLFDGNPFFPNGYRLSDLVANESVTHFGTSAKYLDACAKADISPASGRDFSALRAVFSTGSPLAPDGFDYVYENWKADVCLSSVAGGTDIVGCFLSGNPIGAVYRGECQKRALGLDVRVFDPAGESLVEEPGELVCVNAHPSMPTGFWNDPDGSRYRAAYFEQFENVWHHGDYVMLTENGGMVFYGRSDATLNPGGVRIGTAEIYEQVERVEEVLEALVIGQDWQSDTRLVLFVRLAEGQLLTDDLVARIKSEIRSGASPRHVPAIVLAVNDIPRTKSGKITELAVRDVVHDRPIKNLHALANPEALDLYRNLPELQV